MFWMFLAEKAVAWIFGTIGHETESDRDQRPFGPLGTQFSSFW